MPASSQPSKRPPVRHVAIVNAGMAGLGRFCRKHPVGSGTCVLTAMDRQFRTPLPSPTSRPPRVSADRWNRSTRTTLSRSWVVDRRRPPMQQRCSEEHREARAREIARCRFRSPSRPDDGRTDGRCSFCRGQQAAPKDRQIRCGGASGGQDRGSSGLKGVAGSPLVPDASGRGGSVRGDAAGKEPVSGFAYVVGATPGPGSSSRPAHRRAVRRDGLADHGRASIVVTDPEPESSPNPPTELATPAIRSTA